MPEPAQTSIIQLGNIPLAGLILGGHWSLLNLILSAIGVLLALVAGFRTARAKKQTQEAKSHREKYGESVNHKEAQSLWLVAAAIFAVIAVIVFILTQNMRQPMVLVDVWTIAHAIIITLLAVSFKLNIKKVEDEDEAYSPQAAHMSA